MLIHESLLIDYSGSFFFFNWKATPTTFFFTTEPGTISKMGRRKENDEILPLGLPNLTKD